MKKRYIIDYNATSIMPQTETLDSSHLNRFFDECKNEIESGQKPNYTHINDFLKDNNIRSLEDFNTSICMNTGEISTQQSFKTFFVYVIAILIFTIAFFLKDDANITSILILLVIGVTTVAIIPPIIEIITCTKKVEAICIDINRTMRNSDHVYRPLYFVRDDKSEYIICGDYAEFPPFKIGEIINDFWINPKNPFQFTFRESSKSKIIFSIIAITFFSWATFITIQID